MHVFLIFTSSYLLGHCKNESLKKRTKKKKHMGMDNLPIFPPCFDFHYLIGRPMDGENRGGPAQIFNMSFDNL